MAGPERSSTVRFAQGTFVPRVHQGHEDNCPECLFRSTNSLADVLAPNSLSRPTCFASWPLSRVGNPPGSRDALAATRRDALAATRTDRATAHGPRAADAIAVPATRLDLAG